MTRSARLVLLLVVVLATLVAACGGSSTGSAVSQASPAEAVEMLDSRVVIDVRSPEEFAAGHIAGAVNIDVDGDFASGIAQLDKEGAYLLYCRSGRRSAIAAQEMAAAGFTDIVDAGGLEPLAAAGAPLE
ncbi:MAG TPA: rhodanese-like domain-containing protein [Candidatus Limnocylindrales bacterium]|nr:rhodanese-like domain-containing protein [Candidatus Limnocylindrales bacterium]